MEKEVFKIIVTDLPQKMFEEEVGELLTDNGKNGVVFEKCDIIRKNFKPERAEVYLQSKNDMEICLKKNGEV